VFRKVEGLGVPFVSLLGSISNLNFEQVVCTHVQVTEQYNLVLVKRFSNTDHASQTSVVYPLKGSWPKDGR